MITFSNFLKVKESSPATRIKTQAALGLAPPVADIFSHGTPPPWQVTRLKKALKKSHKKKRHKKKRHMIGEAKKSMPRDLNFDKFMSSIELLAKDIWELKLLKNKKETQEKIKKIMKKNGVSVEDDNEVVEKDDKKIVKKDDNKDDKKIVKKDDKKIVKKDDKKIAKKDDKKVIKKIIKKDNKKIIKK